MNILLDTSVLVAAMVETHSAHETAFQCLRRMKNGEENGFAAAHSLAESFSVLTRLPVEPRISPAIALELIQNNVIDICTIVPLTAEDYKAVISHLSKRGLSGGVTYDALIVHAGIKAGVDRIITLNQKDFRRVYPEFSDKIGAPK